MFIRIVKIISSLGLIIVLAILVSEREIMFTDSHNRVAKESTTSKISLDSVPLEPPTETIGTMSEKTSTVPIASSSKAISTVAVPVKLPLTKITPVFKNSLYIPMKVGVPDTDLAYRPAISPCTVTMKYKIGTFDLRFGISKEFFIQEVDKAASLWGEKLGKALFEHSPDGTLTINLIYDERQAKTDAGNNLALEIQNSKDAASALKKIADIEKEIYLGDGAQLTKDNDAFKVRYDIYMAKVAMYNSNSGAPQAEYELMTKELEALKQESKLLSSRREQLLAYMETINAKVTHYNELIVYINGLIVRSNELGAKEFTEGKFTPRYNTIDIYQYNDLVKLRRVVAHELGHVIGVHHNENVQSIMYSMNSATTTYLSDDDTQALYKICPQN